MVVATADSQAGVRAADLYPGLAGAYPGGEPGVATFGAHDLTALREIPLSADAANADTFKGRNGAAGVVKFESGSPDTYTYTDQRGNRVVFFGGNTSGARADFQLWKMTDPAGNVTYVGHASNAATAASDGYNADGTVKAAYDANSNDGRRFSYTYTTIGGVSRLTQVKAETKTGGTWASPTGLTEVARVEYTYHAGGMGSVGGPAGYLESATVRTALSDSGSDLSSGVFQERVRYYRYYKDAFDSSTNPGGEGMLKLVLDAEGARRFDWAQDSLLDGDYRSASDASLLAYAAARYEYPSASERRPDVAVLGSV